MPEPSAADHPGPFAHTLDGRPPAEWEPLHVHLDRVADRASEFAKVFDSADWGRLAGLWHDLGKYRPEFQARLRGSHEHVEHAGAGAALASEKGPNGLPLAFVIAGHHAGLANRAAAGDGQLTPLAERLQRNTPVWQQLRSIVPADLVAHPIPAVHAALRPGLQPPDRLKRRAELWIRFLFSALIDADRLATEAFCDPGQGARRESTCASIVELARLLDAHVGRFREDSPVARLRQEVLADCRCAADLAPGLFSLTAPTGSGKTLSSMAFALRHALRHGLRRVIVVVPYTSIIEQNAGVYREVLGGSCVIEHHSNLDEVDRQKRYGPAELRRSLATENWDAPIIVTTTVQLFESLLSNHPGRCRKLHNIARSVVILDEAQSAPAGYLAPLLEVLQDLADVFGCSVVISTATQPALARRAALPDGLVGVREIVRDPGRLSRALERVAIVWRQQEPLALDTLAREMTARNQVLAIVHLRREARDVARLLPAGERYHLSALMCPAHRSEVLRDIRHALDGGGACRVVATQLVEAGVDVDFPVVFRALAGFESLAQAAGRCNREGGLSQGEFIVFRAPSQPPAGVLRKGLQVAEAILAERGGSVRFSDLSVFEDYFRMLYAACERDAKQIQVEREQLNFDTVAQRVRLIEDGYHVPVVVTWADSQERLAAFIATPSRRTRRALQPFLVQIPHRELKALQDLGAIQEADEGLYAVDPAHEHLYDREFGLITGGAEPPDPSRLIV